MSFEDFVQRNYPDAFDKYQLQERLNNKPETLIGIEVISIRSGFSSSGGTHMTIDDINSELVHFVPNKNSKLYHETIGWCCKLDEFITSVKLADPDLAAVHFYQPQKIN